MTQKHTKTIGTLIVLVIGIAIGWFAANHKVTVVQKTVAQQDYFSGANTSNFKFIRPLLGFDAPSASQLGQLMPLQNSLNQFTDAEKEKGDATRISVYYRDLITGQWLGVSENETYAPASLLKVPIMIDYYYLAQKDPSVLDRQLTYPAGSENYNQMENIPAAESITPGKSYAVSDLIKRMIVYSDNNATYVLRGNLSTDDFNQVFANLGVVVPTDGTQADFISPKTYSLFFRILYGATYLGRDLSENSLAILSQTEFKDGLVAGVPEGTIVAHKFGEYATANAQNQITSRQLHDCGIVYASSKNYLLCVMTEGEDLAKLSNIIKNISTIVYGQVIQK